LGIDRLKNNSRREAEAKLLEQGSATLGPCMTRAVRHTGRECAEEPGGGGTKAAKRLDDERQEAYAGLRAARFVLDALALLSGSSPVASSEGGRSARPGTLQ
jgi:hypothetical protein